MQHPLVLQTSRPYNVDCDQCSRSLGFPPEKSLWDRTTRELRVHRPCQLLSWPRLRKEDLDELGVCMVWSGREKSARVGKLGPRSLQLPRQILSSLEQLEWFIPLTQGSWWVCSQSPECSQCPCSVASCCCWSGSRRSRQDWTTCQSQGREGSPGWTR